MYRTYNPFLDFRVSLGTWISGTTWLKPIWIISVVKFLSFTLTDIFLNAFSAKTSIENQHPKTTSNQRKEARSKNNFEKARKWAPESKVSINFCNLGRPNIYPCWCPNLRTKWFPSSRCWNSASTYNKLLQVNLVRTPPWRTNDGTPQLRPE